MIEYMCIFIHKDNNGNWQRRIIKAITLKDLIYEVGGYTLPNNTNFQFYKVEQINKGELNYGKEK